MPEDSGRRTPIVLLVGIAALLLLVAGAYFVNRITPAPVPTTELPLPMGAGEQAYVRNIQIFDTKVARAANFLNQEITFVFGTVLNNGPRAIRQIEVQLEFHDLYNQTVLRDKQRLFGRRAAPVAPNERRDFQLGYEIMPAQWNQAYPTLEITGLALE